MFERSRGRRAQKDAAAFLSTPVSAIMTSYVVTTKDTATVVQAATRMIAQDISCLIVIDEDRRPKGIITERDYLKKVPPTPTALKLRVKEIMTNKVVTISPEKSVEEAIGIMREHGFRKLVVAEGGLLKGVVTQTDIVKLADKKIKYCGEKHISVGDWMSKKVASVSPSTNFSSAKKIMVEHDIGAMPIKEGNEFIGIFTEYDVVAQFYDSGGLLKIRSPKEIMKPHIRCIKQDDSIFFANRVMLEKKVRRLLVVNGSEVVGILTQTDIIRALVDVATKLRDKAPEKGCKSRTRSPISSSFVAEHLKVYESK